ncbi:MAG: hypothetical protein LBT50_00610 [Prevotellaceae bacterium]|nr:hypothetical protein [Prevotellaceae bacterium]
MFSDCKSLYVKYSGKQWGMGNGASPIVGKHARTLLPTMGLAPLPQK